jgi:hypothetical protein
LRVVEEAGQLHPKLQRVVARLARLAAGQYGFARGQCRRPEILSETLASSSAVSNSRRDQQ